MNPADGRLFRCNIFRHSQFRLKCHQRQRKSRLINKKLPDRSAGSIGFDISVRGTRKN
jgi:hypothetical protein